MKKYFVMTLVLTLLFATVVPAFAAGGPQARYGNATSGGSLKDVKPPFALAGTIFNIDKGAKSVTVTVACGNTIVKPYLGQSLLIQTNDATRFLLRNPGGNATPFTFEDLTVGQKVSVNGQFANNVWMAGRITVGAELNCLP